MLIYSKYYQQLSDEWQDKDFQKMCEYQKEVRGYGEW